MVRSEYYPDGVFDLPPMPAVTNELLERYPQARKESFPENEKERIEIPDDARAPPPFKHLLRYDAESVFWYLLWCCVQAKPANNSSGNEISHLIWSALTDDDDGRDAYFVKAFPRGFLHPAYRDLEPLLESMSLHLQGDISFANDEGRKEDEYLHEVFQRLILNFLSAKWTKDFMRIQKHKQPRDVLENPMDRSKKSTTLVTGKRQREPDSVSSVSAHGS